MLKKVVIAATALTLLASAAVYAQQRPFQPDGARHQARVEDRAAFLDARVAALHAGLRLSADQEKSWATFEQAYRELAALRSHRQEGERNRQRSGHGLMEIKATRASGSRSWIFLRNAWKSANTLAGDLPAAKSLSPA